MGGRGSYVSRGKKGTHGLYDREKKLVANVKEIWKNRNR